MFGIVAAAGGVSKNITFVGSSVDNDTSLIIPSFQNGDYAFIFQSNLGTTSIPNTPTNFTSITTGTISGGGGGAGTTSLGVKISYKKMATGDSSNITLSGSGVRAMALVFRPDFSGTLEDYGSPNTQSVTTDPALQTVVGPSTVLYPHIIFGHYSSSGVIAPRSSSVTMSEIQGVTTSQYVKYKIYNAGDTAESVEINMDDEGTNSLQSFYFQIQG